MSFIQSLKVEPFFRWYDLWIGAYVDTKNRVVYICPFPCFGIKVSISENGKNE